ncbi:hypothetical protein J2848_001792 [Azospirillum lipoferum]|uniref:Uncharacterized protein n=1 Tax=Azospirillum lipoferum TaxID=193 RepID=A0A5A9GW12_AZOLI|nr:MULTISPECIES: hypothetical protein [Azospirillum]KAA0597734.1 hypothetical protein FZ942_01150 [Azospirillum lipoferum]MCP1610133.1 hypothetical protein [Azospirillum lipoferum]MDW5534374.1 hypothetical protein [Azospirillum sp. NL1]
MDQAARLDSLHRTHDAKPPKQELRVTLLGGPGRANAIKHAATLRQHSTLAAEARFAAARRRGVLTAAACRSDAWLTRLAATLAHHRRAAVALLDQRNAYSQ